MVRRGSSSDKSHDDTPRLWVEQGERREGIVATVAPVAPFSKPYSYAVPDELAQRIAVGRMVTIPIGRRDRMVEGFCIDLVHRQWEHSLRPIAAIDESAVPLVPKLIELGEWLAKYYVCPLGLTLKAMAPSASRRKAGFRKITEAKLADYFDPCAAESVRLGKKQRAVLDILIEFHQFRPVTDILKQASASRPTWNALLDHGWIELREVETATRYPTFDEPRVEPDFQINPDQQSAVARVTQMIDSHEFRVALLFGVSGSGKTEVYVHAIRHAIAANQQVILLVPEIALTTQLVRRLAARFDNVAIMHSQLTEAARSVLWHEIHQGKRPLVIGTRSAVFAPCPNLGLIIVDEEQDTSFKNMQAPRFHVRDVAVKRGQIESIPVLLGSATPSLETWTNCTRLPHYERIDLPRRAMHQPMPAVDLIDMRSEYERRKQMVIFSEALEIALSETVHRNEQAILLMNRRGFAQVVYCTRCLTQIVCPNCDVPMVFHSADNVARCHYCRERINQPTICPNVSCRAPLAKRGLGTQRVVERAQQLLPSARLARMDSDIMNHPREYARVLADFSARNIDVLIGTQMIAKGLDFPHVSLVGVVDADIAGKSADFRSGESQFQLITQVAGRAGRGTLPGRVIVQTSMPHAPALRFAAAHDYPAFAQEELRFRAKTNYPPYTRLARIILADERRPHLIEQAEKLVVGLIKLTKELEQPNTKGEHPRPVETKIEGPLPCAIPRQKNRYRYDILIRTKSAATLQRLMINAAESKLFQTNTKSLTMDIDPVSLA